MKNKQLTLSIWIWILFSSLLCLSVYTILTIHELQKINAVLKKSIEWQDETIGEMSIEIKVYRGIVLMDFVDGVLDGNN